MKKIVIEVDNSWKPGACSTCVMKDKCNVFIDKGEACPLASAKELFYLDSWTDICNNKPYGIKE